jgi:hypothetical protein
MLPPLEPITIVRYGASFRAVPPRRVARPNRATLQPRGQQIGGRSPTDQCCQSPLMALPRTSTSPLCVMLGVGSLSIRRVSAIATSTRLSVLHGRSSKARSTRSTTVTTFTVSGASRMSSAIHIDPRGHASGSISAYRVGSAAMCSMRLSAVERFMGTSKGR